ncbi:hypothetical protein OG533_14565 [Streptomyces sp. NBC_01186]|uniref:DUF6912 family protein n=1 Tax=unclassified Streptomyces TaxID=2593676 RepID=UPI002DD8278A|nr:MULTISPECIES: hypothetical protein [unclassified Streptomyces]WSB78808.1 hypothetical protein OHB04_25665 [Streptomyces sp. NBC_01775]WSS12989.1 hypothetical protein OG533_14565 [Streptomyces sp. NBC_01186]
MRVYLPSTLPALSQAHGAGELGPGPLEAYAVTPGLRAWCASDDEEELEYAALGRAARASLRLLAEASRSEAVPGRRVVIAVEVPDADVAADPDGAADSGAADSAVGGGAEDEAVGRVRLAAAVPLAKAAAVHVDADDAEADVAAAADALTAAAGSEEAARFAVDGAEDHELLWFATQEIPALLG